MRYAILGSGAVGGLYGSMLARAGHEVHFLLHSDLEHVAKHGIRVDSVLGDFVVPSPNIYRDASDMPPCDVAIVALKSTNNQLLARMLPHVVSDRGAVLSLQNGLDVESASADAVPGRGVLGGCCFLCSNKVGPGHIRHLDYGRIVFGVYQRSGESSGGQSGEDSAVTRSAYELGQRILADMTGSGIDAQWTDDLAAARWRKLMWNIPFNGLSVALDAATDEIMASAAAKSLAGTLIDEVHRGAACCGVSIDAAAIEATMQHTETMVPYDSSMRLDFLHGRAMEVDAIFGSPLRAVERARAARGETVENSSHPMPSVAMLHQQLQFLDSRSGKASNPTH
ncbi:putative 2-dehydropantoate 2-reductase [Allorhodopirellula solitaria]|uniref:2-dehydropantoate 2-reductase n=1 Tax=Allorhodopirellula solitaria TaxID=2527987 RepID=A0A5C5YIS2_9BACT|nr:putative 2-dehydropantoate 2-reductase [Allorhodopirellula solitaria]TWT74772.1 2-dehydropantoate 2-reductase [Allorhodopirellula solitaria]